MKKKLLVIIFVSCFNFLSKGQNAAINNDGSAPDPSALLDVKSTSKGVLIPRMSTLERVSIASPAEGLTVYDSDTKSFWFWKPGIWTEIMNSYNNLWEKDLSNTYIVNKDSLPVNISNGSFITDGILNVKKHDATTTGYLNVMSVQRGSSGTAANGIGGSILFRTQVTNGGLSSSGKITSVFEDVTTQKSALHFQSYTGGTVSNNMYFNSTGLRLGSSAPPLNMLDVAGDINTTGEIKRTSTGASNMVPICYGNVSLSGGINSAGSTSNFSVTHVTTGVYTVSITGESYQSQSYCTVISTVGGTARIATTSSGGGVGLLYIFTFHISGTPADADFYFVTYKP